MILIIAPEDDLHACVVAERVRAKGHKALIWNTTWFPWRERISWTPASGLARVSGLSAIELSEVSAIWWRRFRNPTSDPSITDPHVKRFCTSESAHALRGIFTALGVPVVNDPDVERRASLKLFQLSRAAQLGLNIPPTIVSNDRSEIIKFLGVHRRTICKTIFCDYPHSIPVRQCQASDFEDQSGVALSPIIIQEQVDAIRDVRITVVGDAVFSAELERADINEEVDWRMTPTGWRPHDLAPSARTQILALMRSLQLVTGSLDMRLRADGAYVFLEVNPSGQFLFLEIDAALPISEAFADLLICSANDGVRVTSAASVSDLCPTK